MRSIVASPSRKMWYSSVRCWSIAAAVAWTAEDFLQARTRLAARAPAARVQRAGRGAGAPRGGPPFSRPTGSPTHTTLTARYNSRSLVVLCLSLACACYSHTYLTLSVVTARAASRRRVARTRSGLGSHGSIVAHSTNRHTQKCYPPKRETDAHTRTQDASESPLDAAAPERRKEFIRRIEHTALKVTLSIRAHGGCARRSHAVPPPRRILVTSTARDAPHTPAGARARAPLTPGSRRWTCPRCPRPPRRSSSAAAASPWARRWLAAR